MINFLILAFIIFLLIKMANRMMAKKEEAPAEPAADPAEVVLLREIRDELRNRPDRDTAKAGEQSRGRSKG